MKRKLHSFFQLHSTPLCEPGHLTYRFIYYSLFTQSTTNRHIGCIHYLYYKQGCYLLQCIFGINSPDVGMLSQRANWWVIFPDAVKFLSTKLLYFAFSQAMYESAYLSTPQSIEKCGTFGFLPM